jgi:hypothetical protein
MRLLVGVLLLTEGGRHLLGSNVALVAMTAAVVVGEFLLYAVMHVVIVRFFPGINRWVGAILAVTPVFLVFVFSDAPGKLGTLLFVGISLLFTALRNDAGCEVMTLPGMVFGRRTHLVCIAFSPLDWAEERISGRLRRPKSGHE